MAFRVGRAGKSEDGGCGDGDRDAVRDYGGVYLVAGVFISRVLTGDGVGHAWVFDKCCPAKRIEPLRVNIRTYHGRDVRQHFQNRHQLL